MTRVHAVLVALFFCACSPAPEPKEATVGSKNPPLALFVGDSLTAGYGVDPESAWPALVEEEWTRRGLPWRARNAAVSGSTTAGALEAVRWALTEDVRLVFICIGGNDGLRGTPLAETRRNLDMLLKELNTGGRTVVLAGMKIPPNYGPEYTAGFQKIFPDLARKHKTDFLPFLLEGVAADKTLNLPDGIHPNDEGHRRIAKTVLAFLDQRRQPR